MFYLYCLAFIIQGDNIEPAIPVEQLIMRDKLIRYLLNPVLFYRIDCLFGSAERQRPPRLHLNKYNRIPITGDNIYFSKGCPVIRFNYRKPLLPQKVHRALFARLPDFVFILHVSYEMIVCVPVNIRIC